MEISGLPPERLDRLTALAAELRPLLSEAAGMEKIQRLLAERDVKVLRVTPDGHAVSHVVSRTGTEILLPVATAS